MASGEKMHIVMFPWLAFGHLLPYLRLAKLIAEKGHKISFISTPRNIDRLPKLPHNVASLINLVKIPLPSVANLPENAEATIDVPFDKVKYLKIAYDRLQSPVTHFLESNSVDWILCDVMSYWLGPVASQLGVRCAWYSIFPASILGFTGPPSNMITGDDYRVNSEDFTVKPKWVQFETSVAMSLYQILAQAPNFEADGTENVTDFCRIGNTIQNCDMVAIRSSVEFEAEWLKLVEEIYEKPVIPVGLLPAEDESNIEHEHWDEIKDWLNKQAHRSVIYVAFGAETKLNQVQATELALGLELSGLPFFWAIRKQRGSSDPEQVELPEGFEERTRGRGMVYTTWVPQIKILSHDSVGGLLIHSGWSSVVEAVQFGKALVLLPFLGDQGIIAKQVEEKKLGFLIPRNESDGGFTKDSVAASVKLVMVDEQGKIYRDKVKELKAQNHKNPEEALVENDEKQGEMMTNADSDMEDPSPRVLETPMGSESDHSLDDKLPENEETFVTAVTSPLPSPSSGNNNNNIPINIHGVVQLRSMFDIIKKKSVKRLSSVSFMNYCEQSTKSIRWKLGKSQASEDSFDWMVQKPSWRNFTLQELEAATKKFSPANLIGKGGHAEVYKGCFADGQIVAVKRITKKEKKDEDRVKEFLSELGIIAHINHPNAAKLIGFGTDNGLFLVLQFAPNGSLASLLHGDSAKSLDWNIRFKVAIGIADGLKYLHCDCQRRIIHRDITASNILLSEDYEPEISDFGLAKWLPEKWLHHTVSPIEGTFGYMAPEYFMHGIVHEQTDVFAFGVILLELITGRRAVDSRRQSLVKWAKPFLENNNVEELADPRLGDKYDIIEMRRAISAASMCVNHSPDMRPNMSSVLQLLRGESDQVDIEQQNSSRGKSVIVDAMNTEGYNSTAYLKDLDRHKELVME